MTIAEKIKAYREQLAAIYDPREARSITNIVFQKLLELDALHLGMAKFQVLTYFQQQQFEEVLKRLLLHEPVQYVLGETEFYGLTFELNKYVLIPRPETEELVEWILTDVRTGKAMGERILDIGTGSGCMAIALAKNLADSIIEAIDNSEGALRIAALNNSFNDTKVAFLQQDILTEPLSADTYDIIVSNPPYITESERELMAKNVLDNEPHSALFVPDTDALVFYKRIAELGQQALTFFGTLYFELNENRGAEVVQILRDYGYSNIELRQDMSGKQRMVKGEK